MAVLNVKPALGTGHMVQAYVGKDNPIILILRDGEEEYDFSGAKSVRVKFDNVILDSEVDEGNFDLKEASIGKLVILIGRVLIEPKTYNARIEIVEADERILYFGTVRVSVLDPGM